MWSELFFTNLKDSFSSLFTSYSNKELEYVLYEELKSNQYEPFLKSFVDS